MRKFDRKCACFPGILLLVLLLAVSNVSALDTPIPSSSYPDKSRVTAGLVVLYDFAAGSGSVVPDVSGVGSPLDLEIGNTGAVTWLPGGGLSLDSATIVRSTGPATKIIDAVTSTNAITVEAWLAPGSVYQSGPARIVTCSTDPTLRNFTLGQGVFNEGEDRYVMRLRTSLTSDNGIPETSTAEGSLTTDLTHVVYTRDAAGAVTFFLDSGLVQSGITGGTCSNWDANYAFALGNELTEDRPWLGSYFQVAVYDRALSVEEVGLNFAAGPQGLSLPSAPVIISSPVLVGALDQDYLYDVGARGYPAPAYSLLTAPTGMTIDAVTGFISWTPDALGDYPVEVVASNSEGSENQPFTVTVYPDYPIQIEVWHGLDQRIGHLGPAQADFNVLGKVSPAADVSSLAYQLNGGAFTDLTIGPDNTRLDDLGDFNADIPISLLQTGLNTVTVRAIKTTGLVSTVDVNVTLETGGDYLLPATISWGDVTDPQDVGQYVDGHWTLEEGGLGVVEAGYDRIFLVGTEDWQDYEALVPITINGVYPGETSGLGLLMRFTGHIVGGHRNWPDGQPKWGYQPFGGIGWLRWIDGITSEPTMQFYHGDWDAVDNFGNPTKMLLDPTALPFGAEEMTKSFDKFAVAIGDQYWMRMRCETQPDAPDGDGVTKYSWKIWSSSAQEPVDWSFQVTQESQYALRQGGLVLLAHHVDATFGDVQVTEIPEAISGVTNLTSTQVITGNPSGNVTLVDLSWTPSVDPNAVSVSVYRKGHDGVYPEYVGDLGPDLPLNPLAEGWELVDTVPVGTNVTTDLPATRDFWYYCAQANDSGGNPSAAVMTTGVLNYLLGDASDGGAPIADGDNLVSVPDLVLLGSHYFSSEGDGTGFYLNFLDFGPTHDMSVSGRPRADNRIDFEDLMVMAINYNKDATATEPPPLLMDAPPPSDRNSLTLDIPDLPGIGQTFAVDLVMIADGQVQGLQVPLLWDESVIEFVDFQSGPLLADQGGQTVLLTPLAGMADIALAGLRERGVSGVGTLAQATLRVIGAGAAGLQIGEIQARDGSNGSVTVGIGSVTDVPGDSVPPRVSVLHQNYPNPFNPLTTISFDLAVAGRVRISVYNIDGRLVQALADRVMSPGGHSVTWDARKHASGVYFYRLEAPGFSETKKMIMVK